MFISEQMKQAVMNKVMEEVGKMIPPETLAKVAQLATNAPDEFSALKGAISRIEQHVEEAKDERAEILRLLRNMTGDKVNAQVDDSGEQHLLRA